MATFSFPASNTDFQVAVERTEKGIAHGVERISFSDLTDLAIIPDQLGELTSLRVLGLENTRVSDLAPLADLKNLEELHLAGSRVSNIEVVSRLPALRELYLDDTPVTDLAPLRGHSRLSALGLKNTKPHSLAPLKERAALEWLYMSGSLSSDLAPLAGLPIKALMVDGTKVLDLRPILSMPMLGELDDIGLAFHNTPAANATAELVEIAEVGANGQFNECARRAKSYLSRLDPWPAPLPWEAERSPSTDGPAYFSKITEAQISNLLAHAAVHEIQTRVVADQIRFTLARALPEGLNDTPLIFRLAEDLADILDATGSAFESERDMLRERIEALEQRLADLTAALCDAESRAMAEAALAEQLKDQIASGHESGGYWGALKTQAGEQSVKLPLFFAKTGAIYYLITLIGPNHPLTRLLLDILNKL